MNNRDSQDYELEIEHLNARIESLERRERERRSREIERLDRKFRKLLLLAALVASAVAFEIYLQFFGSR